MKFGHKFWGVPIILGLVLAIIYPYSAFQINTIIYYLLFVIMFFASLNYDLSINELKTENKKNLSVFLFFGFLFMPALQWILSRALLQNQSLQSGFFYAALSPIAIVAPHFVSLKKGKDALSYQLMIISTLTSPVVFYLMSHLFEIKTLDLNLIAYIKDLCFLCVLPILISILVKKIFKFTNYTLLKAKVILPALNFICIGLIGYTLLGTMLVKVGLSSISNSDLISLFLLAFVQDFGTYFLGSWLLPETTDPSLKKTLLISISIKNVAMTGGLLLFYNPLMAFAASTGLFAHALFFIFLSYQTENPKPLEISD